MNIFWVLLILGGIQVYGFVPVNPGLSIGIKSRSNNGIRYHHHPQQNQHGEGDTVVKLHPSLTTDLKPRHHQPDATSDATHRKAKQTNFQDLKATLLNDAVSQLQIDDDDDNIVPDTIGSPHQEIRTLVQTIKEAPKLPESYLSILPASYYATHTYVPPIKNLYTRPYHHSNAAAAEFVVEELGTESSITSDKGNFSSTNAFAASATPNSISEDPPHNLSSAGEIITVDLVEEERKSFPKTGSRKLSDIGDSEDDDPLVEAEDEGTNFIPSRVVPSQLLPNYNPQLRYSLPSSVSDSTFGVSVTPISIDKVRGLKKETSTNPLRTVPKIPTPPIKPVLLAKPSFYYYKKPSNEVDKYYYGYPLDLDQLALDGQRENNVLFHRPDSPQANSLFYLGPEGPSMPVFTKMSQDLGQMMKFVMTGPVKEMSQSLTESKIPMMSRVGNIMSKVMGGHVGDSSFDIYDWLPLVALLTGAALILAGLFPTGLTSLGLNNGALVLGRRQDRAENENESVIEMTLAQLETGVMMIGALRHQDGCSKRLACRLGQMARDSEFLGGDTGQTIVGAVHAILPEKYTSFARSIQAVAENEDDSSCHQECFRCISI